MTSDQDLAQVRRDTAAVVQEWLEAGRFTPSCDSWLRRHDPAFTRALAERGLVGLTWPPDLGGRGASGAVRLVVTEELLRHGAPVAAHWIADRQIGPAILEHGSETARRRYLPGIASGEVTFCLGMSEPGSGSDLASVATRAVATETGWRITGQKIWTSQAHRSTHAYVLARTGSDGDRHAGLTEFLVDLAAPGVDVRPIHDLAGEHHFNEVFLDGVDVDADHVLGEVGAGWTQVTEQLALERGGVERVLSTYPLFEASLEACAAHPVEPGDLPALGTTAARYAALRAMAFDVTVEVDAGRKPVVQAALLKLLGTALENDVVELGRQLLRHVPEARPLLDGAVLSAPGFTIRGGTTEVLRGIVARALGTRRTAAGDLAAVADDALAGRGGEPSASAGSLWAMVDDLGWPRVGVPETGGGEGGDLADAVELVVAAGRNAVSLPLAESVVAGRATGRGSPLGATTVAADGALEARTAKLAGGLVSGVLARVPWASSATSVVAVVAGDTGPEGPVTVLLDLAHPGCRVEPGTNLAGEPRETVHLDGVPARRLDVPARQVLGELALLRAAAVLGALEGALRHAVEHAADRHQFGRPLRQLQAVQHLLTDVAAEAGQLEAALRRGTRGVARGGDDGWRSVAAVRVLADRAATTGARSAHQVLAAMGITREHPLHLSTRRLWSWRDEAGSTPAWRHALGSDLVRAGADATWGWLTEQEDADAGGAPTDEPTGTDLTARHPEEHA